MRSSATFTAAQTDWGLRPVSRTENIETWTNHLIIILIINKYFQSSVIVIKIIFMNCCTEYNIEEAEFKAQNADITLGGL